MYRRNMDTKLQRLKRLVDQGDIYAIPEYIHNYLRANEQPPPQKFEDIEYYCAIHDKKLHTTSMYSNTICDKRVWDTELKKSIIIDTPCKITPKLANLESWINIATKQNLFKLKKREFKEPVTPEEYLERFLEIQESNPGYVMFREEFHDYLMYLEKLIEFIAEIKILPPISKKATPIPWEDLIYESNLRIDLIEKGIVPQKNEMFDRSRLSYCSENTSPLLIVGIGNIGRSRVHDKWGSWWARRGGLWVSTEDTHSYPENTQSPYLSLQYAYVG